MPESIQLTPEQAEFVITALVNGAEVDEELLAACDEHPGALAQVIQSRRLAS